MGSDARPHSRPVRAADQPGKSQTCCQKAAAEGKECTHKCCVTAHKEGKSCEKCNPNKEDLKLKKPDKKAAATEVIAALNTGIAESNDRFYNKG